MDRVTAEVSERNRRNGAGSLARKYSRFTALLLGWVSIVFFAYDMRRDRFDVAKALLLSLVVVMVAGAVSRFTIRLLGQPLNQLRAGISAVREGRLEPIQVSRSGDEVEYLTEGFNAMIRALVASREEVRQHQELLEERIRERTEALEEATQRALAGSRAKSEFLANTSHELRTPMNGILGMIDIVLDSGLSNEQREQLETAKACANTLLALLNDILDLSKIEAGRMSLERIPFDLRGVAGECVRSMLPKAREKGIALEWVVSPDLPALCQGDPLRLRQILNNLLSNAVKFTAQGSVELRLESSAEMPDGRFELTLEVVDTGQGIPPEKLTSIFEEFTQADGSISRRYGGTGLGLAITRRLVTMHGGQISVRSEVGRGSAFRVTMPYESYRLEVAPDQAGSEALESPKAAPALKSAARILVVEDNLVNQKVVETILTKKGYQVRLANHGVEALRALELSDFDLVLLDVQMPEMDGITATHLIRRNQQWKHLPIVAMTAHAMEGDRERCLQAGMNGYIAKPVSQAHLVETVARYLRGEAGVRDLTPSPEPAVEREQSPPIDGRLAARLLDNNTNLMHGMTLLFLQLAPERLHRLQNAAVRLDIEAVRSEAHKLGKGADRIAAVGVSRWAHQIENAAAGEDFSTVHSGLAGLAEELSRLDFHVRPRQDALA